MDTCEAAAPVSVDASCGVDDDCDGLIDEDFLWERRGVSCGTGHASQKEWRRVPAARLRAHVNPEPSRRMIRPAMESTIAMARWMRISFRKVRPVERARAVLREP